MSDLATTLADAAVQAIATTCPVSTGDRAREVAAEAIRAVLQPAAQPVAVLRREIGEGSWFDNYPVAPGSKTHLALQESGEMDYCVVYDAPPAAAPVVPSAVPDDDALEAAADILQQAITQNGGSPSEMAIDWVRDILAAAPSAPATPAPAVPVGDGVPDAVALAYGLLWHVNAGMDAPMDVRPPSLTPEKAAHEARKLLRDLMTSTQRGDGINAAREMLASLPAAPAATKEA